jgi:hypothetical protein
MSEQYRLRWQDAVEKLDAPKGNELTPLSAATSFSNQEAKWLSCSKLLNQIDLQAKGRSGGMADAADSKSVGRKPVKVRLLSPAVLPFFSLKKLRFLRLAGLFECPTLQRSATE